MTRGFTLVEIVVAIVIFEVGVLGVLGTLVLASRTMARAEALERAVVTVERVADSLSIHDTGEAGAVGFAGGRVVWGSGAGRTVVALSVTGDTLLRASLRAPVAAWPR
jgi:Tfp pilus assembly protein PilV